MKPPGLTLNDVMAACITAVIFLAIIAGRCS